MPSEWTNSGLDFENPKGYHMPSLLYHIKQAHTELKTMSSDPLNNYTAFYNNVQNPERRFPAFDGTTSDEILTIDYVNQMHNGMLSLLTTCQNVETELEADVVKWTYSEFLSFFGYVSDPMDGFARGDIGMGDLVTLWFRMLNKSYLPLHKPYLTFGLQGTGKSVTYQDSINALLARPVSSFLANPDSHTRVEGDNAGNPVSAPYQNTFIDTYFTLVQLYKDGVGKEFTFKIFSNIVKNEASYSLNVPDGWAERDVSPMVWDIPTSRYGGDIRFDTMYYTTAIPITQSGFEYMYFDSVNDSLLQTDLRTGDLWSYYPVI